MTLFLAGPTGSGKSAVAVELAEMLDAEIVSSDGRAFTARLGFGKTVAAQNGKVML